MARKRRPQGSGSVRQLPSGRWQARYRDDSGVLRSAPATFETKLDASTWLGSGATYEVETERTDPTLAAFAAHWLPARELKPRTSEGYQRPGIVTRLSDRRSRRSPSCPLPIGSRARPWSAPVGSK